MSENRITPIETLILQGLVDRFQQVFNCVCAYGNTFDRIKIIEKLLEGKDVKYPYAFLNIQTLSHNIDSYATNVMARTGLESYVLDSNNAMYKVRLMPTAFEVEVIFISNEFFGNSQRSILEFTRRWLFARRNGYLKFNVNYGANLTLRISAALSESITLPTQDNKTERQSDYELTTSLTVQGYTSEPKLVQSGIVTDFQVNNALTGEVWEF